MEALNTLVVELVILVVLAVFLQLLIPAGDLSRYVRMVFGLLIIVAVLQVATGFWQQGRALDLGSLSLQTPAAGLQEQEALEAGQRQWEAHQEAALKGYRDGLERQITALAGFNPGVEITEVRVELDTAGVEEPLGSIRRITLSAVPAGDGFREGELEQLGRTIAEFYDLEPERVVVGGWREGN